VSDDFRGDSTEKQYEVLIDGVPHVAAGKLAAEHGFSRDYIARLARQGTLRGRQLGTHWYVEEIAFRTFLVLREYKRALRRHLLIADRKSEYQAARPLRHIRSTQP
jgi:hypothetical protein